MIAAIRWRRWPASQSRTLSPSGDTLLAEDTTSLQGLAPASVLSCEHDPLGDEAEQYARDLQAAGVDCTLERLPGMIHACIHLRGVAASTGVAVQRGRAAAPGAVLTTWTAADATLRPSRPRAWQARRAALH
ncbi:alpha/beta hydrolase fold domain-containing protein [Stenotrophomonas sp. CC22-02]|uniref:alpha/beta hydrolase fold domain-containing protein n=1 Tax=Stenotrophomonas sp. CC22-02 TaxID=1378087 RepID=UPI001FBB37C5|nr:alpha/beta hydrolase fold domain-containing protein [Stenotrophomonas sp. CC22-02]